MKAKILWIEGKRAESPQFITALRKKDFQVEVVTTGNDALARLHEYQPDMAIVFSASMRHNGKRICKSLQRQMTSLPIILIANPDQIAQGDDCANLILTLPFTPRKLVRRIFPMLPWASEKILNVGPIQLDVENRRVRCEDRQAHMTPHLVLLLKVLMLNPNKILTRSQLFLEVWDTKYLGDTRTLDVHISWLREAIEANPRQPVYLRTIRGVGYRLEI